MIFSVVVCFSSFAPVIDCTKAWAQDSPDTIEKVPQAVERVTSVSSRPACQLRANLDFLDETGVGTSQLSLTSAAWFARMVQLDRQQRQAAWNSLPVKPLFIDDVIAGPFGLHATVLTFPEHVLVMYRGTQDPLDYVLNALIYTTPGWIHGLPGWIHNGFLSNFGMTWRKMRRLLKQRTEDGRDIVFASHSLGGAMSQYAAWRIENEGLHVRRIFAFQSPNPGDQHFRRAFDERFYGRAFNTLYGDDLTPFLPPPRAAVGEFAQATAKLLAGPLALIARIANYSSVGARYAITKDGALNDVTPEWDLEFWRSYKQKSGGKPFPMGLSARSGLVADHNMDRVMCSLAKNQN
jgi:hypothetical protein